MGVLDYDRPEIKKRNLHSRDSGTLHGIGMLDPFEIFSPQKYFFYCEIDLLSATPIEFEQIFFIDHWLHVIAGK